MDRPTILLVDDDAVLVEALRAVLEQHYTAGGATHSYERAGYEWDVGVHYLGDMGARTTVRRLMDFLTQGQLDWAPMDAHYDRFFIGDRVYDAVAGRAAFRDNLVAHFPREAQAIDRYLQLLGEVSRGMRTFTLDRTLPPWAAAIAGPLLRSRLPANFDRTTWEVLSELTDDPELIAVLTGQWGDMGLPPKRSSFVIQALIAKHYLHGGFYPVGGAWRIADTILPRIRATGGEVFTYARVEQVLVQDGRTRGVRMADGHEIESSCVVSDAGVINTLTGLVPREVSRAHGYDQLMDLGWKVLIPLALGWFLVVAAVKVGIDQDWNPVAVAVELNAAFCHVESSSEFFFCSAKGPVPPLQVVTMFVPLLGVMEVITTAGGTGTSFSMRPLFPVGPSWREQRT